MKAQLDDRILAAVPEVTAPEGHTDSPGVAKLRAALGDRLTNWALTVGRPAVGMVNQLIPPSRVEILGDIVSRAIQQQSLGLVAYLAGDVSAASVSHDHRMTIIDSVRLAMPIYPGIVGGVRVVEEIWRNTFIELILSAFDRAEVGALLRQTEHAISTYFDQQIDETTALHTEQAARVAEGRSANRRLLVDRIIAGEQVQEKTVVDTLQIRPQDTHVGLIVWGAAQGRQRGTPLDFPAFSRAFTRVFERWNVLSIPAETDAAWMWLSGAEIARDHFAEMLSRVLAAAPGALIAHGTPGRGQAGFRTTHLMAQLARLYGTRADPGTDVFSFRDWGLHSLLLQDPERARWFVEEELGPLLGAEPGLRDLRDTLRLLARTGSVMETAEALFVHRNTVAYRLKRAQELLGRDPLTISLSLHAALVLEPLLHWD